MKKIISALFALFLLMPATAHALSEAAMYRQCIEDAMYERLSGYPEGRPLIAIVIDDMGVSKQRSARAIKLPADVTLSFLPYPKHVGDQVAEAKKLGHEIFLHLPWEADNLKAYPGRNHLAVGMSRPELREKLKANLDAFQGYVGVNNHMGSKFSRYQTGLEEVMTELKRRKVFYLDSKTTRHSLAERIARTHDIVATHRDVFLDHEEDPTQVGSSLKEVEGVAIRTGSVIAIGHPKDMTLDALEKWLPTLEEKGFQLVPASEVIKYRQQKREARVSGVVR